MSQQPFKGDPPPNSFQGYDPRVIELNGVNERAYWCKALQVSEAKLIEAVGKVGHSVQKVKEWLAITERQP